jgi:parallel beta-helix repeat protein
MRYWRRPLTVGLSVLSLLAISFTAITVSAGAATPPATVNFVVSTNGLLTDPGCPTFTGTPPTPELTLAAAVSAATTGQLIYVCTGNFSIPTPAGLVINKALTIDGTNWNSTASTTINAATQSELSGGTGGILVENGNVTIKGLTISGTNSLEVRSFITGAGDQGESNVTISNNLFSNINSSTNTNGADGDVHFGLGQDFTLATTTPDVTALDTADVVSNNVFNMQVGLENQAVELSDTTGASITGNTVNYPTNDVSGSDDNADSALWLDGLDQAATVSGNTLIGGGIDNDASAVPSQSDPKSGIKVIDSDAGGPYGNGCSSQTISGNTISGFAYGIAMISTGYNGNVGLCAIGPTGFTVNANTISGSRVDGIFLSGTHGGTVTNNTVTTSDTEACSVCSPAQTAGQYDFFDSNATVNGSTASTNAWTGNSGDGTSSPSAIGETSTTTTTSPTTTTTSATTTTTVPATTTTTSATTTTTVPATTTTAAVTTTTVVTTTTHPAGTTTTTSATTTTTVPPTTTSTAPPATTTTAAPKPVVTVPTSVHFKGVKVIAIVHCARARCAGILQLTKVIRFKAEIGHSGKFHIVTKTLLLGKTGYATGAGSSKSISIVLKGAGLKLVKSLGGHKFTAVLTFTSAGGTRHEAVTFTA